MMHLHGLKNRTVYFIHLQKRVNSFLSSFILRSILKARGENGRRSAPTSFNNAVTGSAHGGNEQLQSQRSAEPIQPR